MKLEAECDQADRTAASGRCTACGGSKVSSLLQLNSVPVHQNLLYARHEDALHCPSGQINLCACENCGFVFNEQFDSKLLDYSEDYENSQDKSSSFTAHMQNVAVGLVRRHNLDSKRILEIGCGKGAFLNLIVSIAGGMGKGLDPSYANEFDNVSRLNFVKDFFPGNEAWWDPDLIVCRHVLEHIDQPRRFINLLRDAIPDDQFPTLYFEVPSFDWITEHIAFWDVFYEHCNYFTAFSIGNLLKSCGFEIEAIEHSFAGQYLSIDARPSKVVEAEANTGTTEKPDYRRLAADFKKRMEGLQSSILDQYRQGEKIAIWGAAAKGCTFLNQLELTTEIVSKVIDINPRKQGNYIAGTGQLICAPEFLKSNKHDVVYIMNPNYESEIRQQLNEMGVSVHIIVI